MIKQVFIHPIEIFKRVADDAKFWGGKIGDSLSNTWNRMKASVVEKLEGLVSRRKEVTELLSDPDVIADQDRFRALSKEYAQLEPVVQWLETHRQGLTVFTHALSGQDLKDHTDHVLWLGEPVALKLEVFAGNDAG